MFQKKQETKAPVQLDMLNTESISMEDKLLSARLVSAINKQQGHVSISLTDKGLLCLLNAYACWKRNEEEKDVEHTSYNNAQQKTNPPDKLLTKKEVMKLLDVCDTTLYLWSKRGYLPCVKVGSKVRYRTEDVYAIINHRKEGGAM